MYENLARPLRIEYADACYHVMSRGRGKIMMFHDERYFNAFLKTLEEAHERFSIEIHAYCLMDNHYHLLVKTPLANLSRSMRHINGVYTQRYNKLKATDGPLIGGRYKAIVVQRSRYFLRLTRYIHRNPIEATPPLAKQLPLYTWSSYQSYLGLVPKPPWLYTEDTYSMLSGSENEADYRQYVEDVFDTDLAQFYQKQRLAPVLGTDSFKREIIDKYTKPDPEHVQRERVTSKPSIDFIVRKVADHFGKSVESVYQGKRNQRNTPRWIAMSLCQSPGGHSLFEIAQEFGVNHYGGVAKLISKCKAACLSDNSVMRDMNCCRNSINRNK